jgi:predicted NAD-dependent protein-ADP-ribosyltransferase YbiA (DUF1768 family)
MSKEIKEVRYEKKKVILFNSYSRIGTEVLSNLHICRLEYDGKVFNSSEQLFYWLRLYGYVEYQGELLRCETPKDVKKKGSEYMKKLGIVEDLERNVHLLRLAIRVKYNCCEEFRKFLDNHPNIPIVEYAWWGDTTFGCVDEDSRLKYDWSRGAVIGKNVCGRIIRGVRNEPKDDNGLCIITRPECLDTMRPLTLFS